MGIFVPRPSMRKREERQVKCTLVHHMGLMTIMTDAGVGRSTASSIEAVVGPVMSTQSGAEELKALFEKHEPPDAGKTYFIVRHIPVEKKEKKKKTA